MPRSPAAIPVPPLLAGLSAKKLSAHRATRRVAQGYEQHPPACRNCARFQPARLVVVDLAGRKGWSTPYCRLGNFACDPHGVCDLWVGRDGSTLET